MRSNHTVILTTFKITAIKFKVTEKIVVQNNWKLIGQQNNNSEIFNNILSKYIAGITEYYNYNNHIL